MALTDKQIEEAFALFDVDCSGEIDAHEMNLAIQGLGFGDLPKSEIAAMIAKIDKDKDGKVSLPEFKQMMNENMAKAGSAEEIWKAYKLFDAKQSGRITFDDLKRVAALEVVPISDVELRLILKYGCEYPDKGISFDEWRTMMNEMKNLQL